MWYGPYMKNDQRLEIRCSQEFLDEVDSKRGVVPRGTFVKALAKRALAGLPEMAREEAVRASEVVPSPEAIEHVLERPAPTFSAQDAALERQARLNKSKGLG